MGNRAVNFLKIGAFFVSLVFGLLPVSVAAMDLVTLSPVDEGPRDDSFLAFRDRLKQIVQFKEPERLVELVDFRVVNGVGEPAGMKAFSEKWRIDAIDSPIWKELEYILNNGGGFIRSELGVKFCAPYVYSHFPTEIDVRNHVVAMGENIQIKENPELSSSTVLTVSHAVLQTSNWQIITEEDTKIDWLKVKVGENQWGYINRTEARAPKDYHACFSNSNEKWRIFSLEKN
ncbi:MAG: hypothetical protein OEZ47_08660 [Gammaproteobacteria bacterium]|nr:hypothetical protein [Gammaproteobacteria bacterium]